MTAPIIQMTDAARERAKALLEKNPAAGLRIGITTKGCSGMSYKVDLADEAQSEDEVVSEDGVTVYVDPKAVMYILGTEMDFVDDKFFSGFVFRNPNEKGRCGCGESFHV